MFLKEHLWPAAVSKSGTVLRIFGSQCPEFRTLYLHMTGPASWLESAHAPSAATNDRSALAELTGPSQLGISTRDIPDHGDRTT